MIKGNLDKMLTDQKQILLNPGISPGTIFQSEMFYSLELLSTEYFDSPLQALSPT